MDKTDGIQIGRTYVHVADLTRTVRVTRIWTDDDGHACVAYDVYGYDVRGRPVTTHSALRATRFAQIYQPA